MCWQHRVCEAFRNKGYWAEIEVDQGDRFLDVFASDEAARPIGVQVVTGDLDSYEFVGIQKNVGVGLEETLVAGDLQRVCDKVESRLPDRLKNLRV